MPTPDFGMSMAGAPDAFAGKQPHIEGNFSHFDALPPGNALKSTTSQQNFYSPNKKGGQLAKGAALHNQQSPALYKVPGGRYIPKKEMPSQLAALEVGGSQSTVLYETKKNPCPSSQSVFVFLFQTI